MTHYVTIALDCGMETSDWQGAKSAPPKRGKGAGRKAGDSATSRLGQLVARKAFGACARGMANARARSPKRERL